MACRVERIEFPGCRRVRHSGPLALILSFVLVPAISQAQWQPDGTIVGPVGPQSWPRVAGDGAGGVIVAWSDYRSGTGDIYLQRMDVAGRPLWTSGGVPLCIAASYQTVYGIVSDGSGGAIVVWEDSRAGTPDIYAGRVNVSGTPLWTANGVALCTATDAQYEPKAISDGAGGAIVVWQDHRTLTSADVYARRVNASGTALWATNGVAICALSTYETYPVISSDAAGGAIIAWTDARSGASDVYAQRVSGTGSTLWTPNGVVVSATTNYQDNPCLVPDGAGGAIVAWADSRFGNVDVYAQRLDPAGASRWAGNGIAVCLAAGYQNPPTIVADGFGGAIMAWLDQRGTSADVYAQRVSGSGTFLWAADGAPVCTMPTYENGVSAAADGLGGAIITWMDSRNGPNDLYAQRVSDAGATQWAANGVPLITAPGYQYSAALTSDGSGNVLAAWEDWRGGQACVYTQRLEGRYGAWGHPEPTVASVADVAHDQGGRVAVNWSASPRDLPVPRTIGHYSIWRAVDPLSIVPGGRVVTSFSEIADLADVADVAHGEDLAHGELRSGGPLYLVLTSPPEYYWELAGTQDAQGWPAYSFSTPTRADSVAGNPGTEFFMVAAHDKDDAYVAFPSNVSSGHSTDNLAPAPPGALSAQRKGVDVLLHWDRVAATDLRDYAIYRADASGVTPIGANLLAGAPDTVLVDAGAPASALYYIVTAYDVHENQSVASNEASVSSATGIRELPAITGLMVLPNRPNPFAQATQFEIGLPSRSDVAVEIYDVAGRRVRSLTREGAEPGWVRIPFDGRDDAGRPLASGVSFYRITANGMTVTRKMVITR